jgi:dihydrofolate reductase
MPLHLIYARSRNQVIGQQGGLPWHLPEDLAHFKRTTLGQPVIMGRITWESLPAAFRPLPGRTNVVVSRQPDYVAIGAQVVASLQAAIDLFPADQVVWLIGGAQLYAQAMPMASRLVVTDIDADFEGDAFAPEINPAIWHETHRSSHVSAQGLRFSVVTYERPFV